MPKDTVDHPAATAARDLLPGVVHFCAPSPDFDEHAATLQEFIDGDSKPSKPPVVDLRRESCKGLTVREAIVRRKRIVRQFLRSKANLAIFVTDESFIECLSGKLDRPLEKSLKELSSEGSLLFVYTKGCDVSKYSDNLNHIMENSAFDPISAFERAQAIKRFREAAEKVEGLLGATACAELVASSFSLDVAAAIRPPEKKKKETHYSRWKESREAQSIPNQKGARKSLFDHRVTKYVFKYIPNFSELFAERSDIHGYDSVLARDVRSIMRTSPEYFDFLRNPAAFADTEESNPTAA